MKLTVFNCPTCGKTVGFPTIDLRGGKFVEVCPECGDDEIVEGYICPTCHRFHTSLSDSPYCDRCKDQLLDDLVLAMVESASWFPCSAEDIVEMAKDVLAERFKHQRAMDILQELIDERKEKLR